MKYLQVSNLFFDVSLLLKFWASGFCCCTLYMEMYQPRQIHLVDHFLKSFII